jgi:Na+-transporting NADH:ubiquinone oxidoreductase subunit C
MNRQSNTYTIIYSIILVVVVGLALSIVYQALRPKQVENIDNDTKRQILAAALITPENGESVAELYSEYITDSYIVNTKGEKVDSDIDPFAVNVADQVKEADMEKRLLPVFVCNLSGKSDTEDATGDNVKYIIPVYGAGLWGPIWGYVAMDANGENIYGAYFAHQGETPGLGAEIEKPEFSDQFQGKDIFSQDGAFQSIEIVKNAPDPLPDNEVHAISGGTITSQGVQKMLSNSLEPYTAFFKSLKK